MMSNAAYARYFPHSLAITVSVARNYRLRTTRLLRVVLRCLRMFFDMDWILQEEYIEDEEVGRMKCEHQYHVRCIQEWLRQKNWCPICKASAVPSSDADKGDT